MGRYGLRSPERQRPRPAGEDRVWRRRAFRLQKLRFRDGPAIPVPEDFTADKAYDSLDAIAD